MFLAPKYLPFTVNTFMLYRRGGGCRGRIISLETGNYLSHEKVSQRV